MADRPVTTHLATVAAPRASDPDLPAALKDRPVYVPESAVHGKARGGLPRSLQDMLGRIVLAEWADDAELRVVVSWGRSGRWAQELLDDDQAALYVGGDAAPGGRAHLVIGLPQESGPRVGR